MQIISDVVLPINRCKTAERERERQSEGKRGRRKRRKMKRTCPLLSWGRRKKISHIMGTMFHPFFCFNLFAIKRNIFRKVYKFLTLWNTMKQAPL